MKIGIIGAGFTGLTAAYRLSRGGHEVILFESEDKPGGLAIGFKEPHWRWSLENHYHHLFASDRFIKSFADEIGQKINYFKPRSSTFIEGKSYQLDSPISLLLFDKLSIFNRLRTGAILAYLKITSSWRSLENVTAKDFLIRWMGKESWSILWKPLFEKKFGKFADEISASWFWARIKKRSSSLGYPDGGFLMFAERIANSIWENKGNILYKTSVKKIVKRDKFLEVKTDKENYKFDCVISTLPSFLFANMVEGLPEVYKKSLLDLEEIGTINLILSLRKHFLEDGSYWLGINEKDFPFVAVVEHTNFIDKSNYGNEHLIYLGNYLSRGHKYFKYDAEKLTNEFLPFLKKINRNFDKPQIIKSYLFKSAFSQPIITLNYSNKIPSFETPIKGLYLANIEQVYPWDRGTNYAVEMGQKVAKLVIGEL